jgi:hypothetical protein
MDFSQIDSQNYYNLYYYNTSQKRILFILKNEDRFNDGIKYKNEVICELITINILKNEELFSRDIFLLR